MGTQKEGEARQTAIGTIFSAMLQRKSREFPSVEEFLKTIGMSFATYSQLLRGLGNPTAHTITRTGEALGLSGWEMLGLDEKIVRGWLAGQDAAQRAAGLSNMWADGGRALAATRIPAVCLPRVVAAPGNTTGLGRFQGRAACGEVPLAPRRPVDSQARKASSLMITSTCIKIPSSR